VIGTVSSSVPYVGRAAHRAAVAEAFREPGHVVVIRGEAGVGKSALVAAERAAAVTDVIEGSCLQLAGQPLPLAALEQIFDARGGWPAGSDEPQAPEQRLRAVRQWAEALVPAGATGSTTLVVEDLHWADETTCDFLVYVASTAGRRRLSLVVTLRDDETPRVGRVQQLAAELSRLPGAADVELGRLDRTDAAELVALLTGKPSVDIESWYE
jgi:predicted ATPase